MNPIALFLGFALLAAAVFYVASPFRTPVVKGKSTRLGSPLRGSQKEGVKFSPEKQRQAVLLALRDLDFDYQAGKVAEEDYQALRSNLLAEAAQLIQGQEREKEDSIEALIQSRRQARSAMQPPVVAQPGANGNTNGHDGKRCQHCQAPLKEGARFCSKCGSPVVETTCPKCQQRLQPDDLFCPACGTAVNPHKENLQPAARPEGD